MPQSRDPATGHEDAQAVPLTFEGEEVVAMVFACGKPCSIITSTREEGGFRGCHEYDINFSRYDNAWCFHLSGAGFNVQAVVSMIAAFGARYWAVADVPAECAGRRLARIPAKWLPSAFLAGAWDTRVEWCRECNSWIAVTEDFPCPHTFWCAPCGWWSTPSERCEHTREEAETEP